MFTKPSRPIYPSAPQQEATEAGEADPLIPAHSPTYIPRPTMPLIIERRIGSLSSTYATFFVLFVICYGMSIFTLAVNDFLRISKDPLFGSEIRFGLFESCLIRTVNGNQLQSCHSWPSADCKLNEGNNDQQPGLSFCQGWLASRYLEIGAVIFGGLAIFAWGLMISDRARGLSTAPAYWLTLFYVSLQIIVMKIIIDLKGDDTFYFGGAYGNSFIALLGSWILAVILLVILTVTIVVRRSSHYVYHQI
ncbi:hypothetical protein SmJEL517_g04152 [Synchytrium microbalum]|uniref:Uncharacterized protein n=1 Tax=Synchytrium microbalum TaxID=1806994 RepID=A0A507C171_9FUNG|nr:uncharacterized protein SmJEL517_g04152 [Synchytrium microbalum]TPX32799.1 hypothetical protein SmJEL517_g04152 [Synchytrium microbalum]